MRKPPLYTPISQMDLIMLLHSSTEGVSYNPELDKVTSNIWFLQTLDCILSWWLNKRYMKKLKPIFLIDDLEHCLCSSNHMPTMKQQMMLEWCHQQTQFTLPFSNLCATNETPKQDSCHDDFFHLSTIQNYVIHSKMIPPT